MMYNYQVVDNRETRRKRTRIRYNGYNKTIDFAKNKRKRKIAEQSRKKNRGRRRWVIIELGKLMTMKMNY